MNALPDDSERPGTVTGLQLDVLRALWRAGEATVTEVHAALQTRRRLAPTTVATLLKRLASKQLVEHRQEGRALVYHALIAEDEVVRRTVDEVAEQVFEGDVTAFAAQLLRRGDVNQGDLDRIRALIEARERELEG